MKKVILIILPFAMAVLMSCNQQPAANNAGGSNNANANIENTKKVYSFMSEGNLDSLDAYVATDIKDHNPDPMQKSQGLAGLKEMMGMWKTSFSDMKIEMIDAVAEGDMVLVHAQVSGKNTGAMGPMPATNKEFKVDMYEKLKFANGKCTDRWGVYDEKSMMTQLGLMPPMGGDASAAPGGEAHSHGDHSH